MICLSQYTEPVTGSHSCPVWLPYLVAVSVLSLWGADLRDEIWELCHLRSR